MMNFDNLFDIFEENTKKEEPVKKQTKSSQTVDISEAVNEDITEDDDVVEDDADVKEVTEVSEKTNASSKKSKAKSKAVAVKDIKVNCPITCLLPNKEVIIESAAGKFNPSIQEVTDALIDLGYNEVALLAPRYYSESKTILYTFTNNLVGESYETLLNISKSPCCVAFGDLQESISITDTDSDSDGIIGMDEISVIMAERNASLANTAYIVDSQSLVLIPIFSNFPGKTKVSELATQEIEHLCMFGSYLDDFDESDTIEESFKRRISELKIDVIGCDLSCRRRNNTIFGFWIDSKGTIVKPNNLVESDTVNGSERLYKLPLNLWLYNFNIEKSVTEVEFAGKKRVTIEDIREYLAKDVLAFSDNSRDIESLYSKKDNRLAIGINSGKKGRSFYNAAYDFEEVEREPGLFQYLRTAADEVEARALQTIGFFHSDRFLIENTPVMRTITNRYNGDVDFFFKLPAIPRHVLATVVSHFAQYADREMIVDIIFDKVTKQYIVSYPDSFDSNNANIIYNMRRNLIQMREYQVMQIHSHSTGPAYFSKTDNADEKLSGIYGVIGNVDTPTPSFMFRVGANGYFKSLEIMDLFE